MRVNKVSQLIRHKSDLQSQRNIPMKELLLQSKESIEFQKKYVKQ
jgi:hypothetical protein